LAVIAIRTEYFRASIEIGAAIDDRSHDAPQDTTPQNKS